MSELNPNPTPETPFGDSRAERREERRLERENRRQGIFWPLFLIAAGILFLMHNAGMITGVGWSFIISLWPVLLIVGGLDGLWRGEGIAGSLFWLGIGVIFLMANLGYIPVSIWSILWRFWPILLVVIGLDIIIGRRAGIAGQVVSVVLALALLGGLVWFTTTQPVLRAGVALNSETITAPLQGATLARTDISMAVGQLRIASGADAPNLVQGQVDLSQSRQPAQDITVQNGQANFTLREEGTVINVGANNRILWDLKLNGAVPTDLRLSLGAGENDIDLTGMKLSGLDVNMGAGQTTVTLPKEGSFNAKLNGAVGELVLRVPRSLPVEIQVNRALTGMDVDNGFNRNGNIITNGTNPSTRVDLSVAVGSVRLELIP